MTRQAIPLPIKVETVDMKTGASTPGTMTAQLMPAREGTCEICATTHEPHLPHNAQSLFYQVRFNAEHGRGADWRDAMAHCDDDMKALWTKALGEKGIDVAAGQVSRNDDEHDCANCAGEGFVYGCSWDWQCDTYDEGEGACLCTRPCDWCSPQKPNDQIRQVLANALSQPQDTTP